MSNEVKEATMREFRLFVWGVLVCAVLLILFSVVLEYIEYRACLNLGMTPDECFYYALSDH